MKKLLSATVALSLLAGAGAASAQSYDRYDGRSDGRGAMEQRYDGARDYDRDDRGYRSGYGSDRDYRGDHRRYDAGRYQRPAGYQHLNWRRGDRLPMSYRAAQYRVDYGRYGLRAPPRGYRYNRVDNDVVMTAIATGVIAAVMIDIFND